MLITVREAPAKDLNLDMTKTLFPAEVMRAKKIPEPKLRD
jgi:hypothetical protein